MTKEMTVYRLNLIALCRALREELPASETMVVVELGVDAGGLSKMLAEWARDKNVRLCGVDIDSTCTERVPDGYEFIHDTAVGGATRFEDGSVHFVFHDTSHLWHDTCEEIIAWHSKFAREHAIWAFHDTNIHASLDHESGQQILFGWDNDNGVYLPLCAYVGGRFNRNKNGVVPSSSIRHGWKLYNDSCAHGMVVLFRTDFEMPIHDMILPSHTRSLTWMCDLCSVDCTTMLIRPYNPKFDVTRIFKPPVGGSVEFMKLKGEGVGESRATEDGSITTQDAQ